MFTLKKLLKAEDPVLGVPSYTTFHLKGNLLLENSIRNFEVEIVLQLAIDSPASCNCQDAQKKNTKCKTVRW